ncbi:MAG: hypothetical protein RLZZ546_1757 [Bacteroidota bacterium]|jgi:hypothetical protein
MKVIYKYELARTIQLPIDSQVLKVGMQNGIMQMWVLVDSNQKETSQRNFEIIGTGHSFEFDYLTHTYIDSLFDGPFVWHIWEANKN